MTFAYTSWQPVVYVPQGTVSVGAKKPHRIHGPGRPLFITMGNIFAVHLLLLRNGSSLQLIVCPLISMLESTKLFWVSLNLDSLSVFRRFQGLFVESTDSPGLKLNIKTES